MGIQTSSINNGPTAGFKNAIINGTIQYAQRGTSGSTSGAVFLVDRFNLEPRNSTTCNWSQSTDVPSGEQFTYSLRINATNVTDDGFHIRTGVELPRTGSYGPFQTGTQWTLSLWAKSAYSGRSINPAIFLANQLAGGASSVSQSVFSSQGSTTIPTSWTRLTFNYTLPTWTADSGSLSNVICLVVRMLIGDDNNPQDVYITGVQLELGPVATDFEQRPVGTELALCQRYFQNIDHAWATTYEGGTGAFDRVVFTCRFGVEMRAAPSVSFTGSGYSIPVSNSVSPSAGDKAGGPAAGTPLALTTSTQGISRAQASRTYASGQEVQRGVQYVNHASVVMTADAEL